jgi:linoleoyl-CoA desaturase
MGEKVNTPATRISFKKEESRDFLTVLRERVNLYFSDSKISPKANRSMIFKTLSMIGLMALTYTALLSGFGGAWGLFGFYILLGYFTSTSTMGVAHDALHGAYLNHPTTNRMLGLLMDVTGASSFYWKKEHTIDHHSFTNIADHDADLDVPDILRLCPKATHRPIHRFQHWYAPFLYSLNLLNWAYSSDSKRILRVLKDRESSPGKPSKMEVFLMIAFKFVHLSIFLAVPMMVLSFPWWQITLGYITFMAAMGLNVTTIFQLAHIVENVAFPLPDEDGKMENSFAKHQLTTTSNFAMNSKIVRFLVGGLNFQVEHHLLPHVCHIHLHKIAPIVQETAKEFGFPYHSTKSFGSAIKSHFKTLKKLGRSP